MFLTFVFNPRDLYYRLPRVQVIIIVVVVVVVIRQFIRCRNMSELLQGRLTMMYLLVTLFSNYFTNYYLEFYVLMYSTVQYNTN